jgi:hypothetical protein
MLAATGITGFAPPVAPADEFLEPAQTVRSHPCVGDGVFKGGADAPAGVGFPATATAVRPAREGANTRRESHEEQQCSPSVLLKASSRRMPSSL